MTHDATSLYLKIQGICALINVTENSLSHWDRGEISPDSFYDEIYTLSLASKKLSDIAIDLGG
jgi:DNA-binding transcriptional regulator YiaG